MKISQVKIDRFRRFTKLVIRDIPKTARLIVLCGPNGCGKSSLFDALHTWYGWRSNKHRNWQADYHSKVGSPLHNDIAESVAVDFHDDMPPDMIEDVLFPFCISKRSGFSS